MHAFVLFAISQFLIAPIPMDTTMNQNNAVVRGSVSDYGASRFGAGVAVFATSPAGTAETVTDSNGYFYFLTLLPGDYRFFAVPSNCSEDIYSAKIIDDGPIELDAGFEYLASISVESCR